MPCGDPAVVLLVGQPDRGGVVGRDDQLDVDRALGGAAHQVRVRDVAVVLARCGSRSPRGRRCAGSRGSRPTGSGPGRRTRPRAPSARCGRRASGSAPAATVPSRWTCSSASGSVIRGPAAPAARRAARRRRARPPAARSRPPSALASPRAWTIASGRSGPTSAPIGATSAEPDAVVDLVVLAPAVAAEAGDDEADGARVDAVHVARALGRDRRGDATRGRCELGLLDKSAGPPSADDHRAEALGGAAVVEHRLDRGAGGLLVGRQPRLDQRRGGQRERHLVQARLARARRSGGRSTRAPRARCPRSCRAPRPCR